MVQDLYLMNHLLLRLLLLLLSQRLPVSLQVVASLDLEKAGLMLL